MPKTVKLIWECLEFMPHHLSEGLPQPPHTGLLGNTLPTPDHLPHSCQIYLLRQQSQQCNFCFKIFVGSLQHTK